MFLPELRDRRKYMESKNIAVHVVSHSHWDREWYVPFEIYRNRLNVMMEKLFDELNDEKSKFEYFTLDGQTIIIEDYLERYPQNYDRLRNLVNSGKIDVGPWYVLPDEFLIQGETFVRNYLIGKSVLDKFGMKGSRVGYLPDMFGHTAYTPSLLKELGLSSAVLWRGPGKSCRKTEFIWESESGDRIPVVHLVNSYSNAANFGLNIDGLAEKMCREIGNMRNLTTGDNLLLMNGTDHEFPIFEIAGRFEEIGEITGTEVKHSNLGCYVDAVFGNVENLEIVRGELRDSTYEHVLKDVLSSRIYLKLLSFEAQQLFIKYVEPLSAICLMNMTRDAAYFINEIAAGWKLMLQSLTHDGICGCSTDRVQRKVEDRLADSVYLGSSLTGKYMRDLFPCEDEINPGDDFSIMVFNPDDRNINKKVETRIPCIDKKTYRLYDENGKEIKYDLSDEISSMNDLYETRWYKDVSTVSEFQSRTCPHKVVELYSQVIAFKAEIPFLGFAKFDLKKCKSTESDVENGATDTCRKFENDYIEFTLNDDATIDVKDKRNGIVYRNLNKIMDVADQGDEYNFSYMVKDNPFTLKAEMLGEVKVLRTVTGMEYSVDIVMPLPSEYDYSASKRSENEVQNMFTLKYVLYGSSPRIDVQLSINNKARDHKTYFEIGIPRRIDDVLKDSYYGFVRQPAFLYEYDESMAEENISRYAMETMSAFLYGGNGIVIASRGIHEFESCHKRNSTIGKYTLLRSVGMLSRKDLNTRKGEAGPCIPTPEAQCLCEIVHNYSIIPVYNSDETDIMNEVTDFLNKPVAICGKTKAGFGSTEKLNFYADRDLFLKSFKISENGDGINLRFVDVKNGKGNVLIKNDRIKKYTYTDMAEKELSEICGERSEKSFTIDRVGSIKLKLNN